MHCLTLHEYQAPPLRTKNIVRARPRVVSCFKALLHCDGLRAFIGCDEVIPSSPLKSFLFLSGRPTALRLCAGCVRLGLTGSVAVGVLCVGPQEGLDPGGV